MHNCSSFAALALCALGVLAGCGGSTSPDIVQFGIVRGDPVTLDTASVSQRTDTLTVLQTSPEFWQKALDADENTFYVRYARNFQEGNPALMIDSVGRKNHRVPLTDRDYRGTAGRFGSRSFSDDGSPEQRDILEGSTTSRTITVFDVLTDDISHGVMFTRDESARGSFLDSHAYAGGRTATDVPTAGTASYSGVFLGHIAEASTTPTTDIIELDASMSIDFAADSFTGALGTGGATDITLAGTASGDALSGSAEISSTALGMATGRSGGLSGRVFGEGATSAAGSLTITDNTGANFKVLVGSFGVQQ